MDFFKKKDEAEHGKRKWKNTWTCGSAIPMLADTYLTKMLNFGFRDFAADPMNLMG
jgi:hypothetical protein